MVADLKNQLSERDTAMAELKEQMEGIAAKDEQIATLTDRVAQLEAENEKLKAGPTQTEPKEDPAVPVPGVGKQLPANQAAYEEDIKAFKE